MSGLGAGSAVSGPLERDHQPRGTLRWVRGPVPGHLERPAHRSPLIEAARDMAIFRLPTVGRFLVRPGRPVVVEQAPGASAADVECMLAGPVGALGCCLEGIFCLRGAAVEVAGKALVVAGSVRGTSSLVAAVALRGGNVIADGVVCTGGEPLAAWPLPSGEMGRLILWPDTWRGLCIDPAGGRPVRRGLASRAFALGGQSLPASHVPVGALVLPTADTSLGGMRPFVLEKPLGPAQAVAALRDAMWHAPVVADLGMGGAEIDWLARLAALGVREIHRAEGAIAATLALMAELAERAVG